MCSECLLLGCMCKTAVIMKCNKPIDHVKSEWNGSTCECYDATTDDDGSFSELGGASNATAGSAGIEGWNLTGAARTTTQRL